MIIYFSATGNCKYVAEYIAYETNDTAASMQTINQPIKLNDGESLGIITPTYCWKTPSVVDDLLEKMKIETGNDNYVFSVSTYGTTPGQSAEFINRFLKKKNIKLNARFKVKMPDTWTPIFNLSDKEKVAEINRAEIPQIKEVIKMVQERTCGDFISAKVPTSVISVCSGAYYDVLRKTKHLKVKESCIGCGLCAKNCPVNAIEMKDGKPIWVKDKCTMCLQCLHKCPKYAISYGRGITDKHGQYQHPKFMK